MKDFKMLLTEFEDRVIEVKSLPVYYCLESVKGCPHSCAMCRLHPSQPERISEKLIKKISPYFKHIDVLAIHAGGEPLLGDLERFVSEAVEHDSVLYLETTGFFLTREIVNILLKARLSIRFSIHAGKPETYKRIMGRDFKKVVENIAYLIKQDRENSRNSDFWFSFIVMKENLGEIEEFLELAHDMGIKHVRFMLLHPNIKTILGFKMKDRNFKFNYFEQYNPNIAKEFLNKLPYYKKLAEALDVKIEAGSLEPAIKNIHYLQRLINAMARKFFGVAFFPIKQRKGICVVPWLGQLIISQNGDVNLCSQTNYVLGNIYRSTLEEIWNCKKIKRIREIFRQGAFPKICGYCRGMSFDEYPRNSLIYASESATE